MKILKIKDVVMVALLTALYFIIYNIAGMLAMVFGAFGHAISPGICGLFCGIIMYFVSKKVGKFLQFTLMQAIIIVLFTIMGAGYIPWVITSIVAALIADIIASREMNPAVWKLGIASGVFHVGQALGSIVPAMFFMESYKEDWIARGQTAEQMEKVPDSFIVRKWINAGEPYVKNVNGRWYLDPAYPETVELIESSVREILGNYDVDGVHIDDYFYPTTDPEFDREAFEVSGSTDLAQWRMDNVNRFVKAMYDAVKNADERLVFGISPQGNIDADYNSQYADVRRWGSEEGYCDYIIPQIYFGFENENSPFLPTLKQWEELVDDSIVSLIIGLAAYKLGREDKWAGDAGELEWINDPDIIRKQIAEVKNSAADGYALYY